MLADFSWVAGPANNEWALQDAMRMEFMWNAAFVMQSHSWTFHVHQNFDLLIQLMSSLASFPCFFLIENKQNIGRGILTGATSHKAPDRDTIGTTTVS